MIKHYCDRCEKEIDEKSWRLCYYESGVFGGVFGEEIVLDVCEGCKSEFEKWFGADILANGWVCPKCGRVMSPTTPYCPCNGQGTQHYYSTGTTPEPEWLKQQGITICEADRGEEE